MEITKMKWLLNVVLTLALLPALNSSANCPAHYGRNIMHLGDSLTLHAESQIQADTTADSGRAWVWAQAGITINAPFFLSLYQYHQSIGFNPNGIVIALGTNDSYLVSVNQKSIDQVKADVTVMLDRYATTPIQWIIPTNPSVNAPLAKQFATVAVRQAITSVIATRNNPRIKAVDFEAFFNFVTGGDYVKNHFIDDVHFDNYTSDTFAAFQEGLGHYTVCP